MKNKNEVLGLVTNIVLVILLLCFIILGLNIIGIYSLPEPLEKLIGTYEHIEGENSNDYFSEFSSLDEPQLSQSFEEVKLDYSSAYSVLSQLKAAFDYVQRAELCYFHENISRIEKIDVSYADNLYTVNISDKNALPIKSISETHDGYFVITDGLDKSSVVKVKKGSTDINELCGFVLTSRDFIMSDYELSDADFTTYTENGTSYIAIEFDRSVDGILLHHKYVFSLDFGIVSQAEVYENADLVFSMKTLSLSYE